MNITGATRAHACLELEPAWMDAREHVKSCEVLLRATFRDRR